MIQAMAPSKADVAMGSRFLGWGGFDYIYLATEERKMVEAFTKRFPDKVIVNKRKYYDDLNIDYSKHMLAGAKFGMENDKYLQGMEYLSSMVILSKCNSLIGGWCGGTCAANYMKAVNMNINTYFPWEHIKPSLIQRSKALA